MDSSGIVENQPIHKASVKYFRVKQLVSMVVNVVLLDSAIESLAVSIHLGCPGIGVVMNEMEPDQFFIKMLLKLRPIVGEDKSNWMWKYFEAQTEELFSR